MTKGDKHMNEEPVVTIDGDSLEETWRNLDKSVLVDAMKLVMTIDDVMTTAGLGASEELPMARTAIVEAIRSGDVDTVRSVVEGVRPIVRREANEGIHSLRHARATHRRIEGMCLALEQIRENIPIVGPDPAAVAHAQRRFAADYDPRVVKALRECEQKLAVIAREISDRTRLR